VVGVRRLPHHVRLHSLRVALPRLQQHEILPSGVPDRPLQRSIFTKHNFVWKKKFFS
jgi:hypothetical protein